MTASRFPFLSDNEGASPSTFAWAKRLVTELNRTIGVVNKPTLVVVASEDIAAGAFVNLWNSGGLKMRNANATAAGKEAQGFVIAPVLSGKPAIVYLEGTNTMRAGLTVGATEYLATTPGNVTETAPTTAGNAKQVIGVAVSATSMFFRPNVPIVV